MNYIQELLGEKPKLRKLTWAYRVYAKVEHLFDPESRTGSITFQGIDAAWFDSMPRTSNNLQLGDFRGARAFLIEIDPGLCTRISNLPSSSLSDSDERWFTFCLRRPKKNLDDENSAVIRENLTNPGWRQEVDSITEVPSEKRAALNRIFRLSGEWRKNFYSILKRLKKMGDPHVVAYDVGQGGAVGLLTANGTVEAYFDFGGGATSHADTFPSWLKFCFSKQPLIVLSHWHFDHWVSAKDHDPRALRSTWLVPEQTIGPFQLVLTLAIWAQGGQVIVWPSTDKKVKIAGAVHLGLCSGTDRNESGLAMLVRTAAGDVLLPGDCGYEHLPDFWPGVSGAPRLLGLVAPHHGGKTSPLVKRAIPVPFDGKSKLTYSVGDPNTYGHVRGDVSAAHIAAGWDFSMTKRTPALRPHYLGNVLLTRATFFPACAFGVGATSCTLMPLQ